MTLLEKLDGILPEIESESLHAELVKFRAELEEYIEDTEDDREWLDALESAGVDNWEGYEEALRIRREWQDDPDY